MLSFTTVPGAPRMPAIASSSGPVPQQLAVDRQDRVARPYAGARRGRIVERRDHGEQVVLDRHLYADAGVISLGRDLEVVELVLAHEGGVRVESRRPCRGSHFDMSWWFSVLST
jgi:hypothetical protein